MLRAERVKRQKLGSVLSKVDAAEERALHDLHLAGYSFKTVDQARRHQKALLALDRFDRDQDADALAATFREPLRARRAS